MKNFADRLAAVERLVHQSKYEQFEKFIDDKLDKMEQTVEEFRDLLRKGEKWVPIAGHFDDIMSRFNEQLKDQLDLANNEYAHAKDLAKDLAKTQEQVEALQIDSLRDAMETLEKKIKEMDTKIMHVAIEQRDSMETLEKKIKEMDTKIMHVAIEQANSEAPTPRGRRQTSKSRSESLQRAAGILKGLTAPIEADEGKTDHAEVPHQQEVTDSEEVRARHQPIFLPLTWVSPNINCHPNINPLE